MANTVERGLASILKKSRRRPYTPLLPRKPGAAAVARGNDLLSPTPGKDLSCPAIPTLKTPARKP